MRKVVAMFQRRRSACMTEGLISDFGKKDFPILLLICIFLLVPSIGTAGSSDGILTNDDDEGDADNRPLLTKKGKAADNDLMHSRDMDGWKDKYYGPAAGRRMRVNQIDDEDSDPRKRKSPGKHKQKTKGKIYGSAKKHRIENNHGMFSKQRKHTNDTDMMLPPRPNVSHLSSNSALVSWSLPPTSGLPIIFLRIQYRELNARRKNPQVLWNTLEDDISPSTTSFVIKKLKTGSTYFFRLAAVYSNNDNRHSPNSDQFTVETSDISKPPAFGPMIVELKPVSSDTLSISWQMTEFHAPVSGFVIQYQVYSDLKPNAQRRHTPPEEEEDREVASAFKEMKVSNPKKKTASIRGLLPSTPYTVRMYSLSKEGRSAMSNNAVAKTLPDPSNKNVSDGKDFDSRIQNGTYTPPGSQRPAVSPRIHPGNGGIYPPYHRTGMSNQGDPHETESMDEMQASMDVLRNERTLLAIACSVLACFLIVVCLSFLFICLKNKFIFTIPFSKRVHTDPHMSTATVRTF